MQDMPPPPKPYVVVAFNRASSFLASIIKIPPTAAPKALSYDQLPCSDADRTCIRELISTMAEHGKLGLLFKSSHLKDLGAKVNHVHPLKFLGVVLSDYYLRECMWDIFGDYFKKSGFLNGHGGMDGITVTLSREADRGQLLPYLHDFAKEVHIPAAELEPYFHSRKWEQMIRHLIGDL